MGYSNGVGRAFAIKKGSFLSGAALLAVQSKEAGIALVCTLSTTQKALRSGCYPSTTLGVVAYSFQLVTYLVKILME